MPAFAGKRISPRLVWTVLGGLVVVGLVCAALYVLAGDHADGAVPRMSAADLGKRILVVAPHPDDEVIAPGGLISEARKAGAEIRVVVMTNGDGFRRVAQLEAKGRPLSPGIYRELGRERHAESEAALDILGVPVSDRFYLSYPDGGLTAMWERQWDLGSPHLGANGYTHAPYDFAYTKNAEYCGASVAADLRAIVTAFRPTAVVFPDPNDTHPDHAAAAAFTQYTLEALRFHGKRLTYLAHFGRYPFPWAYLPAARMSPPGALLDVGTRWHSLELTTEAEHVKAVALDRYRSQVTLPHMNALLHSFIRRNELFGTYAPTRPLSVELDAGTPPSAGSRDAVDVEPAGTGAAVLVRRRDAVRAVRIARGSTRVWMGVTLAGPISPAETVGFHLRLFGDGEPARFDAVVREGRVDVLRMAANSVTPKALAVRVVGDTVWLELPASLLSGHTSGLVSADAGLPHAPRPYRSARRPVRL